MNTIDSYMYCATKNTLNVVVYDILQKALQHDSWALKIYQLTLSQQSKRLLLNTWCKFVDDNYIYLYLSNHYHYLYNRKLHNLIQQELTNNFGKLIQVFFFKNNNFLKKTPIEYIYTLYKERILKLNQELLTDPYIKLIQSIFDIKFDKKNIKLIE